jgi:outer membrane protein W
MLSRHRWHRICWRTNRGAGAVIRETHMRTVRAISLAFVLVGVAAPASAQIVQSVAFGGGWFWPRSFDTRVDGDVLVANLTQPDVLPGVSGSLSFDIGQLKGPPFFGEWNLAFNKHFEVSANVSYLNQTIDSHYLDLVNGEKNNAEIQQTLRLRMIPITGVVRFLPFGDATSIQPYAGGGLAAVTFRYQETGEFVDPSTPNLDIYSAKYSKSGVGFGPVILAGVRVPLGGDVYALTVEGRYTFASGDLPACSEGASGDNCFLGNKIDLSGGMFNFGFLIRF